MRWIAEPGRAGRTLAAVVSIAFCVELLVMFLLGRLEGWHGAVGVALLDAVVLALALAPPLYLLIIRPMRREFEKRLAAERHATVASRMAVTDPLTGALNRRGIQSRLHEAMAQAERYERPLSLVMLDLDGFKRINDTYGHAAGDEVLRTVVSIVQRSLRGPDSLGRYGGDEFLLVLPETPLPAANSLVSRISEVLRETEMVIAGQLERISASAGTVELERGELAEPLLERLDRALYEAKSS